MENLLKNVHGERTVKVTYGKASSNGNKVHKGVVVLARSHIDGAVTPMLVWGVGRENHAISSLDLIPIYKLTDSNKVLKSSQMVIDNDKILESIGAKEPVIIDMAKSEIYDVCEDNFPKKSNNSKVNINKNNKHKIAIQIIGNISIYSELMRVLELKYSEQDREDNMGIPPNIPKKSDIPSRICLNPHKLSYIPSYS